MNSPKPQRIHSIDAVRAVALLGILLVHCHDFCNLSGPKTPPPGIWDGFFNFIYGNLLVTRAFMVFSFLFGLSFFLQMDHAAARGQNFLGRFCWRLILLAAFGVFHSFFYCGDILIIFAITGFILVPLWRAPSWLIATLAGICLLQPLALYHALQGTPGVLMEWFQNMWRILGCTSAPNHQTASFWEIGVWNLRCGIPSSLLFTIYSYRIWDVVGMFMLGLLAGRTRLFEGAASRLWKVAGVSFVLWLGISLFRISPMSAGLDIATNMWEKAAFVSVCVPLIARFFREPTPTVAMFSSSGIWILIALACTFSSQSTHSDKIYCALLALYPLLGYVFTQQIRIWLTYLFIPLVWGWALLSHAAKLVVPPLTKIGRCTLTCYISQSIVMTWLLSGYGLNLRPHLSITGVMLIALALYLAQVVFCVCWMKRFRYGPLEGLWRRLTRIGMSS